MNPIAQLMHISDLHCGPLQPHSNVHARRLSRRIASMLGHHLGIKERIQRGAASHDKTAWRALRRSINKEYIKDNWPTIVALTGDLSTWGDDTSVKQALAFADSLSQDIQASTAAIYGNHDVWVGRPGRISGFPLFSSSKDLDVRRTDLHKKHFTKDWPQQVWITTLPNGQALNLTLVNTIEHERIINAIARGRVAADRYWEKTPGAEQINSLATCQTATQVSIVLTHHPIFDPTQSVALGSLTPLKLKDAHIVAGALHQGRTRDALIVLSGHTHDTFPAVGDSTGKLPSPSHGPLGPCQIQWTAGTASQLQFGPFLGRRPHVWQQLRFYATNQVLRVERTVFSRWDGLGDFEPVAADPNDLTSTSDAFELPLA